ncbi:MAG: SDR family NAD(P)-dependent oxidoreductase [Nostoc sp.]|uniref:SDR family NAD(P)-dependent oxidoreductase n=1 Tax=Nostoc sp. TaxID=1180 RepID=UPI002FF35FB3
MDLQLRGKVALVTAASKGLGKATARQFARESAKVAICARSELIDKTAAEIESQTGTEVLALRADVTSQADIERVINATVEKFGGLDILVTNAGGRPAGTFDDIDLATWETSINLTLLSAVRLVKYALPHLRQSTTPAILTITSTSTKQPAQNLVLSNSIRLAVIGLTKTLSQELGSDKIRVNSILPGWTYTERKDAPKRRAIGGNIEVIGTPEQVVEQFVSLKVAGVDGLQLSFYDFKEDLEFFGDRILPLIKQAGLRL